MKSPSEDIKTILDGISSLGLALAADLFVGELPKSPDACVAIYDTGSMEPPNPTYTLEHPKIMIKVRGEKNGYQTSYALAKDIKAELLGLSTTVGSTRYLCIWVLSDILWLGYDDNRRPLWSINFRMQRTE